MGRYAEPAICHVNITAYTEIYTFTSHSLLSQFELVANIDTVREFMAALPVRKLPGVGRVCEKTLLAFGVDTCASIRHNAGIVMKIFGESTVVYCVQNRIQNSLL